jgi:hypothetical protein
MGKANLLRGSVELRDNSRVEVDAVVRRELVHADQHVRAFVRQVLLGRPGPSPAHRLAFQLFDDVQNLADFASKLGGVKQSAREVAASAPR